MAVVALIGAQWGDEGKGHLVDLLADRARLVVRYGGGNNAGHTVVNHLGTFKLHLIPSGIFDAATINVIGPGVVINPEALINELNTLKTSGIATSRLFISDRAHVIMPYHILLDQFQESSLGEGKIGTTGRGIGPAYADKMSRIGIRMADLLHEETLQSRLSAVLEEKNRILTRLYNAKPLSLHDTYLRYLAFGRQLTAHITNVHPLIIQALEQDQPVLLEGAQGVLLDIDHGTYPYVTSSPPGVAGACQGSGIAPSRLTSVVGVFKAYTTRVGEGPFPTEIDGQEAAILRQIGTPWAEVGTTTGRLRRVGWFDTVMARYATQINGIDRLAITKLDVLDTMPMIKICTGYRLDGVQLTYPPTTISDFQRVEPIYETLPGWMSSTTSVRRLHDLPRQAQAYIDRLGQLVGAAVSLISVGPARDQTIMVQDPFAV